LPASTSSGYKEDYGQRDNVQSMPSMLYFCVPENKKLLEYWKKFNDQLNKIRHCLNIKGEYDPLSPFSGDGHDGLDGDGSNDMNGMQLHYRFKQWFKRPTNFAMK